MENLENLDFVNKDTHPKDFNQIQSDRVNQHDIHRDSDMNDGT